MWKTYGSLSPINMLRTLEITAGCNDEKKCLEFVSTCGGSSSSRKFSCGLKRLDHATWQGVVIMSGPCNLAGEGWLKTSGPCNLAGEGWLNTSGLSKTYKARETASPTTVIAIHFVKGSPSFFFHSSSCDSSSVSWYSWTKTLQPVVYIFLKEELSSADKEK